MVVIGAPIVEELFYRGLLQRSLADRFNEGAVLVFVAAVFAAVHFRPIEFPGLFVFGLMLGWAALRYRRLGPVRSSTRSLHRRSSRSARPASTSPQRSAFPR